jgi:hypothetical protein
LPEQQTENFQPPLQESAKSFSFVKKSLDFKDPIQCFSLLNYIIHHPFERAKNEIESELMTFSENSIPADTAVEI